MLEALYGGHVELELRTLIPRGSFASYVTKGIGRELQSTVEALEEEEEKDGFWGVFPVPEMYELLASGWSLDHEWFQYTDGIYRDDNEKEIPLDIPRSYTASEQMAAYGLYWLTEEMNSMGPLPAEGLNEYGWSREGIIEHKAECLLRAYQAAVYGQKLLQSSQPGHPAATLEEIQKSVRTALARKAADALHSRPGGYRAKREAVIAYWRKNIGADKPNEFAAELLQKEFPDVAHRTLARYVSEAKKLLSASTP